jgi:iron(III) transport system ATP-binding protein
LLSPAPAAISTSVVPVRVCKLTKSFDAGPVVDAVDLAVEPGELFFLLGPSGCGKTTLLRLIAGFLTPDSGTVHIGDRDVTAVPAHKRRTGMVFQSYALWPHMTVFDNVAFGLQVAGASRAEQRAKVADALTLVGMADFGRRRPNELSGGQQQRVALARALVFEPACVLLDEPLSNLDAKLRTRMRAEVRRICKERGLTAIYVTHDQKEALSTADRIAVMDKGRIAQLGPPREVYARPGSALVADFLGETNFVAGTVAEAPPAGSAPAERIVRVQTAFGPLTAVDPFGHAAPGVGVRISLRPEAIRLGDPSADGANRFAGRRLRSLYLGEAVEYEIEPAGAPGTVLRALALNGTPLPPGETDFGFAVQDAVIVEATGGASGG